MTVPDIIRDSFVGQIIYYGSGRRLFRYTEEKPGFILPEEYLKRSATRRTPSKIDSKKAQYSVTETTVEGSEEKLQPESCTAHEYPHPSDIRDPERLNVAGVQQGESAAQLDTIIVDWYGPDDPECPLNWSTFKRSFVTFDICLITFAMYVGAALFAPAIPDMAEKFGISQVASSLGLTLFILGYGVGPMFLAPLSEVPQFGRAPVYMISLIIFTVLQVPTALGKNLGTVASLRFISGFVSSPPMATGGASVSDIWKPEDRTAMIGLWGAAAMSGPAFGPLLSGFAVQAKGWTWSLWELLWLASGAAVFLAFLMPETNPQTILYRRAVRLRRLTGNPHLRSQGEIDAQHMTLGDVAMMTMVRPFILGFREPIVICWNMYLALVYGTVYCFISAFPVVFQEKHGFNLGQLGLSFIGIIIGAFLALLGFIPWANGYIRRRFLSGTFVPEDRLSIGKIGACLWPISLFWFGWTSGSNIHWISPILASVMWGSSAFLLFQAGLNYLVDCYRRHVASAMASNDFFRSTVAASFPLYSVAFFHNLRVGPACSVLGGISIAMISIPFVLHKYGARIRSWSKYAD